MINIIVHLHVYETLFVGRRQVCVAQLVWGAR